MARIRTIKPEFWTDSKTGTLSDKATKLFIGMLNYCDDYGVIRYDIAEFSAKIFPFENFRENSQALSQVFLDEIFPKGLAINFSYTDDEEETVSYLWIKNFEKHQRVDKPGKPLLTGWIIGMNPNKYAKLLGVELQTLGVDIHGNIAMFRENSREFEKKGLGREREKEKEKERNTEVPSGTSCSEPEKTPGSDPSDSKTENQQSESFDCQQKNQPKTPSPSQEPQSPPVISIPLVCKKTGPLVEFWVTQAMVDDWADSYPAVDVMQELREIRQWNIVNSTRRKTKTGILKHIIGWLANEQNKGGSARQRAVPGGIGKFHPDVSTGNLKLDISLTNAANFAKRRIEGLQNESEQR